MEFLLEGNLMILLAVTLLKISKKLKICGVGRKLES